MPQDGFRHGDPAGLGGAPVITTPWWNRHFLLAAAAVLIVAAANLGIRLDREVVTDWDEALYATTAWESVESGTWVGTTFLGQLDYYNSKPPLNVWMIALAFKALGPGLLALRIVSAVSAWLTVFVLIVWARRRFGAAVGLLSGLVLATSFGFTYVHSGRSGNADAPFTLLILLMVVALCAERERPWQRAWLGPIAAGLFLLKGVGVFMPLLMIAVVLAVRPNRRTVLPSLAALVLFLLPCAAWAVARWSVDGTTFFHTMWRNDLIRLSTEVLEGHDGSPLFYLNVLQKNHYEWLVAAAAAWALFPMRWSAVRALLTRPPSHTAVVLSVWAAICLLVPTALQTKLPWYLNPFYPAFALAAGWTLARGLAQYGGAAVVRRRMLVATVAVAVCGAEARLVYYSFQYRDVDRSAQGLLMAERGLVSSARVFRNEWTNADAFVLRAIVGGSREVASGVEDFLIKSQPGDFLVAAPGLEHPGLVHVRSLGVHALYGRTAHEVSGSAIRRTPAELTVPAMPAQERAARGS